MASIPVFDMENQSYWEMEGARLDKYGEFAHIDVLAKMYNYTHDQVFNLSWSEAMTMLAYNKESSFVEQKVNQIQQAADKSGD